jgi:nucleotide-binding universal stress UspA family protein
MEFTSVVCGVDGTPAGAAAADRAARIVTATGLLTLVGVDELVVAGSAMGPGTVVVPHAGTARKAVEGAAAAVAEIHERVETLALEGQSARALVQTAAERDGDLVVVGTHGGRRLAGIILGSTATFVLHDAPSSVLIARDGARERWPASIVVGVDGSEQSLDAYATATTLASRFGASIRAIACTKGIPSDGLDRLRAAVPGLEPSDYDPVDALVAASRGADLVVVGSRGLKGLRALGSVSERVAHESTCSVLVVRHPSA